MASAVARRMDAYKALKLTGWDYVASGGRFWRTGGGASPYREAFVRADGSIVTAMYDDKDNIIESAILDHAMVQDIIADESVHLV